MSEPRKVLVIASWYPNSDHAAAGAFIRDQVMALSTRLDVAVLYVREAPRGLAPVLADEGGILVGRSQLKMPPVSRRLLGRIRAVLTNVFNKFVRYRRAGAATYELLRDSWGTPDIVHVQALWPAAIIARQIRRRYGIPYVVTEHSEEYLAESERRLTRTPGVVALLLRPLARRASRTVAVSGYLARRLVDLGLASNPHVIPNVVMTCEPEPLPQLPPYRVAHVSVMSPAKNLPALLKAIARLREKRGDFKFRLIGDGESRLSVEKVAAGLGLQDVVEFTGYRTLDEIHDELGDSVFTVISSTHETFSVVAADSLMCGRPVLSTRCGGPEEFITPEVGRLIEAGSVDALVEGIDWMLDHFGEFDPQALHEYARARFAPDVVAEQILEVYRQVLDG